jgi:hypothetical protein
MTVKLRDFMKILSTLSAIVTGLVELTKQVNIYIEREKEKLEEENKKK